MLPPAEMAFDKTAAMHPETRLGLQQPSQLPKTHPSLGQPPGTIPLPAAHAQAPMYY